MKAKGIFISTILVVDAFFVSYYFGVHSRTLKVIDPDMAIPSSPAPKAVVPARSKPSGGEAHEKNNAGKDSKTGETIPSIQNEGKKGNSTKKEAVKPNQKSKDNSKAKSNSLPKTNSKDKSKSTSKAKSSSKPKLKASVKPKTKSQSKPKVENKSKQKTN